MKKWFTAFCFSSFTLSLFSTLFGITISGKVSDQQTKLALGGAQIVIINQTNGFSDTTFTNATGDWQITLSDIGIDGHTPMPLQFSVAQNYPNPFNPSTVINFFNQQPGEVEVIIHNMLGQMLDSRRQYLLPGQYSLHWFSKGSAGVYFYTIKTTNGSVTKKMIQLDGGNSSGLSDFKPGAPSIDKTFLRSMSVPIHLFVTNFAYVPDTLETTITGGEFFDIQIETIHSHATVVDLHNDVLEKMVDDPFYHLQQWHSYNHTDIPRLQQGGVDAQFFAVWVDYTAYTHYFQQSLNMIQIFSAEMNSNPDDIAQAFTGTDVLALNRDGKIAAILAVEGGHSIENSIDNLISLYQAGMRYLTITWNNSTDWAVSAEDSRTTTVGLSDFGRQVIRTMDSLGVIIDVSHTGIKTIQDILQITKNPIVATHSGVRALKNHFRNLYDDQIIAIANSGGVIGVVFYPPFLSNGRVNINGVIQHIDYIVNLVGIDYVALGSDFDGIGTNTVVGLENVSKFPDLTKALLNHGYSRANVEKILGKNFLRVFMQVCGIRKHAIH